MLVLERKVNQSIVIQIPPSNTPQEIVVTLCQASRGRGKIGTKANKDIKIVRDELLDKKEKTFV